MGNHLDAMFGRILSEGVSLDLQGGINYQNGLEAVPNSTEGRTDVQVTAAIRALLPLSSVLRITGITVIEGAGNTILTNAGYTTLTGVFSGSANSDAALVAGTNEASVTYTGTAAARVLVIATFGVHDVDAPANVVVHVAKNNVVAGGTVSIDTSSGYAPAATCALVPVMNGDVVALRATTDVAFGTALENQQLSMIAIAIEDSIS